MTDYYPAGMVPFCVYSNRRDCFRMVSVEEASKRFDGVTWLHTCPQGMALDRACNECSEACWVVDQRLKPPEQGGY